jgi:hypothetical protein
MGNLGSVNKLCHALFLSRKLIGRGTASAKGRDHPSRRAQNYNKNRSPNFIMASCCCEIVAQLASGMVHFFRILRYAR